tara:strand:+ start:330 stop:974 length:645 start_codon:yes stop_codon:yes gene_type:complete
MSNLLNASALAGRDVLQAALASEAIASAANTERFRVNAKDVVAMALFVSASIADASSYYDKANEKTKPEQKHDFIISALGLDADTYAYKTPAAAIVSRLRTIGDNAELALQVFQDGANSILYAAKKVAAMKVAAAEAQAKAIADEYGGEVAETEKQDANPITKAAGLLATFVAYCVKHEIDASAMMQEAIEATAATIEPEAEAVAPTVRKRKSA